MKPLMLSTMLATLLLSGAAVAQTPSWLPPADSARCPSKWGAGDERGSGNHMKNPEVVLRGARLIKTGEVIELSHVLGPGMAISCRLGCSTANSPRWKNRRRTNDRSPSISDSRPRQSWLEL